MFHLLKQVDTKCDRQTNICHRLKQMTQAPSDSDSYTRFLHEKNHARNLTWSELSYWDFNCLTTCFFFSNIYILGALSGLLDTYNLAIFETGVMPLLQL